MAHVRSAPNCGQWFRHFTFSSRRHCPTSYPAFIPARGWGPWVRYPRPISAGVLQTAVSRRPRWNSPHLWVVDPECRCSTRSVFGLWALSVDSAIQHQDSIAAVGDLTPFPSLVRHILIRGWCEIVPQISFWAIRTARPFRLPCLWLLVNAAIGRVRGQLACLWYSLNFAISRVKFQYILYGPGEAGVRAWEERG